MKGWQLTPSFIAIQAALREELVTPCFILHSQSASRALLSALIRLVLVEEEQEVQRLLWDGDLLPFLALLPAPEADWVQIDCKFRNELILKFPSRLFVAEELSFLGRCPEDEDGLFDKESTAAAASIATSPPFIKYSPSSAILSDSLHLSTQSGKTTLIPIMIAAANRVCLPFDHIKCVRSSPNDDATMAPRDFNLHL
jgi:hypothetical protein